MKWLNKLERRFGSYAIRDLMKYIVILNALAFVLVYIDPTGTFYNKLVLDPAMVFKGQVWRLVTFVFLPPSFSLLWVALTLYFYYSIGVALEHEWGSFRFNMYYLIGMLGTIAVSLIFGFPATALFINLSLFLAFARLYPDYEILIFYMLPVKIKYIAILDWLYFASAILLGSMPSKVIAIVSLINYFLFFGADIFSRAKLNKQVHSRRQSFKRDMPREITYHRCTVCGRTEKDDPKLEFRYCNECEGDYEYCMEHVRNHEHKTKPSNVIEFKSKQE
jgi:membrane associated rhomboid family serine protease